jgi:S1-C subfamily serine protease
MKSAVRIIKRGRNEVFTEVPAGEDERTDAQSAREIVKTVKGWISELQQRRRDEQLRSSAFRKVGVTLSLLILSFWGLGSASNGQQLRDAFRRVEPAVVIVRTEQKGLAPFPQQGMVSLNGQGSGVLISNDGKVLTAAHLVQAADRTMRCMLVSAGLSRETVW